MTGCNESFDYIKSWKKNCRLIKMSSIFNISANFSDYIGVQVNHLLNQLQLQS